MCIVHQAGRVHSNVDPISHLCHRVPVHSNPTLDETKGIQLQGIKDPLENFYNMIGTKFEERMLNLAKAIQEREENKHKQISTSIQFPLLPTSEDDPAKTPKASVLITSASNYLLEVHIAEEITWWSQAYLEDKYFGGVLNDIHNEEDVSNPKYAQYILSDQGLLYFEDWRGNLRLCVPKSLVNEIMKGDHDSLTKGAHEGYHQMYNRIASVYF